MAEHPDMATWQESVRFSAEQGTLSHAMILCGRGELLSAAHYIAQAHLCTAPENHPCGHCNSCRKVAQDIHPDVTVVCDSDHRYLSVDTIRAVRADAYIRPNEGERRVFIFPDSSLLTEQDQNVLLKVLEEGPASAVFLFCAQTPQVLLPTVRSRCVTLHIAGEEAQEWEDSQAGELLHAVAEKKPLALAQAITAWENQKPKREQLRDTLCSAWCTASDALLACYGKPAASPDAQLLSRSLSAGQLQKLVALLERYRNDCEYNAGVGLVLGAVLSDIEEVIQ